MKHGRMHIEIKTSTIIDTARKMYLKKDLRPTIVDDSSNVRFVNTHSKCYGCNNNLKMIKHKHETCNRNL
jgi:hypothetical protein